MGADAIADYDGAIMKRFGLRFVDRDFDVSAWLYALVGSMGGMLSAVVFDWVVNDEDCKGVNSALDRTCIYHFDVFAVSAIVFGNVAMLYGVLRVLLFQLVKPAIGRGRRRTRVSFRGSFASSGRGS